MAVWRAWVDVSGRSPHQKVSGERPHTTPSRAPCEAGGPTPFHSRYLFSGGLGFFFFFVDIAWRNVAERAEGVRRESSESITMRSHSKPKNTRKRSLKEIPPETTPKIKFYL